MDITPQSLDSFFYGLDARYNAYFERTPIWWDRLATLIPSTTASQRHWWTAQIPRFREWLGERIIRNVAQRSQELFNKDWELTEGIPRNQLQDDQVGALMMAVAQMGERAKKLPDDILTRTIQSGNVTPCWDGANFFDTSHPVSPGNSTLGTYSNNFLSTPFNLNNFVAVRQAMVGTLGEDGKPLEVMPNLLIVPPQLEIAAKQLLNGQIVAPASAFGINAAGVQQSNVLTGTCDVLVVKEFGNDPNTWYMADVSKGMLPFVWQLRQAPKFQNLTADSDPNVFWRKQYVYGADARGNAGYGMPFIITRATANSS